MNENTYNNYEYVSDCCEAPPRSNGDCDTSDFGICPYCGDHCEYGYYSEKGNFFESEEDAWKDDCETDDPLPQDRYDQGIIPDE